MFKVAIYFMKKISDYKTLLKIRFFDMHVYYIFLLNYQKIKRQNIFFSKIYMYSYSCKIKIYFNRAIEPYNNIA